MTARRNTPTERESVLRECVRRWTWADNIDMSPPDDFSGTDESHLICAYELDHNGRCTRHVTGIGRNWREAFNHAVNQEAVKP